MNREGSHRTCHPDTPNGPFYATFALRIRALVLDWFVFLAVSGAVVALAATVHFGQRARLALFTGLIALAVLYEPVLIAARGRTIGHALCNLRVVAPTATGRLPHPQPALARAAASPVSGSWCKC